MPFAAKALTVCLTLFASEPEVNRRHFAFVLAAGMAASHAARAADDAPVPPVDFTRLCAIHGSSFHAIPGTETCVRVGGRVRADAVLSAGPGASREQHNFTTRTRGTAILETRTETDIGLVRTYIEVEKDIAPFD